MNCYQAKQRQLDFRWDYTRNNRATGYCQEFKAFEQKFIEEHHVPAEAIEKHNKFSDKYHTDGHFNEDEACDCYKEYQLDHDLKLDCKMSNQQLKCKVCNEWTQKYAEIDCALYVLCDKHNNREEVKKIYKPPVYTISSW